MKMENTNTNIPAVTVNDFIKMMTRLYSGAVQRGIPFKSIATPFLWGPAGIGKSEAILQVAKALEAQTNKSVTVTDVRLLLFSPVDLRGIPVADERREFSNWLMPRIFDMKADEDHINLLFLDELSAAPQSVQAAAYQICLDRKIGEHHLPANCIVMAAGNRTTDQSVSYKMPKALCNRLMHFEIRTTFPAWRKWAVEHGIDSRIIGYLAFDNAKLCVEPEAADMAYPTPRSWAFVSNLIHTMGEDLSVLHPLISALVGTDTAMEFQTWARTHQNLPEVEEVFAGRCKKYPESFDALHAFTASLVSAIRARREKITVQELENVCLYAARFPGDLAMHFYGDLNQMEQIRLKLMKCPSCRAWLAKNKRFI